MRKNRVIEQNRCYHFISRLAHRAFFLDDEEKDRAVALMRRVEEFSGVKGCGRHQEPHSFLALLHDAADGEGPCRKNRSRKSDVA